MNLGRGLLLAAWRQHEGPGVRSSAVWRQPEQRGVRSSIARNDPGRSTDCLGSENSLLSVTQGVGPPSCPPSPHARPCLHRHWEDSQQCEHTCLSHCCLVPLLPEQACMSQLVTTSDPSHLSKQACPTQLLPSTSLDLVRSRCLRVAHMQRWGQNQS